MPIVLKRIFFLICVCSLMWLTVAAQDWTRDLKINEGGTVEVVNRSGRVSARAVKGTDELPAAAFLTATSSMPLSDKQITITGGGGRTVVNVNPADSKTRIDVVLHLPERTQLRIQTFEGAIEAAGNFKSVEARTETGTVVIDVPPSDLKYKLLWTEARPRYVADFELAAVKEQSGGRYEIKGRRSREKTETGDDPEPIDQDPGTKKPKEKNPTLVSLDITTARGIVLLNVPPNEVASDLRERPLTNAAKAIIRSGDSLLMEAIRRASPRHFGDYSRTLPPLRLEPRFAVRPVAAEIPVATVKTARVRVTDMNNRAMSGLTAADFEITENGKLREIVSISTASAPFNLVLLLDVSGSVENYVNFIRKAARSFVETVDSSDRVSIVIFNDDVKVLSTFTTDKSALSESLDIFDAGGGTAYYDALAYTISDTLRPLKGDRTAVVILTDGDDNRSFLAFDSLIGSIQESGALVYPLYVPSGLVAMAAQSESSDIDPLRRRYMSLTAKSEGEGQRLAKISGGVYYPITQISQIQKAYEDIVLQMRSAYNITFRSEAVEVSDGASPRLKIKARRENAFATVTSVIAAN